MFMKRLLYIDCCIRGDYSRTKIIADAFLQELRKKNIFSLETVVLNDIDINSLDRSHYELREQLLAEGKTDDSLFNLAKQFAEADEIVVSAPFWDMGIPAKLKIYFENVSVSGFTFAYDGVEFSGLCRARRMTYITTRGMDIEDSSVMEQASPYLYALTKFFGIDSFEMISAYGLDVRPDEADHMVANAVSRAKMLAKTIAAQY